MNETTPDPYTSAVHWPIQEQTLTTLSDGYFETDMRVVLPRFDVDEAIDLQRAANRPARPRITHNVYVVRSPHHAPALIDAGMGEGWGPTMGHVRTGLAAIDVSPEEIGSVLLTHLHLDHCAGLVDADGRALFPNAEVVVHADEAKYWLRDAPPVMPTTEPPWAQGPTRFGVARALAPYLERLRTFTGREEILPRIASVPLPGHTPGHSGYLIGSGKAAVLTIGDMMHLPAVQAPRTDAQSVFDVDPIAAEKARLALFDEVARTRRLIAGGHTEFPGVARVNKVGSGYQVVPEPWTSFLE